MQQSPFGPGQETTTGGSAQDATAAGRVVVIGVAIVVDGRVLVGQRSRPPELAGRWELPGGKVEPGEPPQQAAVREIAEELGCVVEVTGWLEGESAISRTHVLRVALARLVDGEPHAGEHAELRWLGPDDLDTVPWLSPDLPLLPALAAHLRPA